MGSKRHTTAARQRTLANSGDKSATNSAINARASATTIGALRRRRTLGGIIDSTVLPDGSADGFCFGGFGGGGKSRIFSFFDRISSSSRSSRDLPEPPSGGESVGGDCMVTSLYVEAEERCRYGTVRDQARHTWVVMAPCRVAFHLPIPALWSICGYQCISIQCCR